MSSKSFNATLQATNFSGNSSGTNTGDLCDFKADIGALSAGDPLDYSLPWRGWNGGTTTTLALTAQREYYFPTFWDSNGNLAGFFADITTNVASSTLVFSVAVRNAGTDQSIGAQYARATMDSGSTGDKTSDFTAVAIPNGQPVWVGMYSDGAITIRAVSDYINPLRWLLSGGAQRFDFLFRNSIALVNALPSTAPALSALSGSGVSALGVRPNLGAKLSF